jgi:hypothetical protein
MEFARPRRFKPLHITHTSSSQVVDSSLENSNNHNADERPIHLADSAANRNRSPYRCLVCPLHPSLTSHVHNKSYKRYAKQEL